MKSVRVKCHSTTSIINSHIICIMMPLCVSNDDYDDDGMWTVMVCIHEEFMS